MNRYRLAWYIDMHAVRILFDSSYVKSELVQRTGGRHVFNVLHELMERGHRDLADSGQPMIANTRPIYIHGAVPSGALGHDAGILARLKLLYKHGYGSQTISQNHLHDRLARLHGT